jgi:N-acetylglucosaminyldiphosphoundecaprenol N-acetyl-beta-D-mannosaminyltransferase
MAIPYTELYGVRVSRMGMDETVDYLSDAIKQRRPNQVVTVNPIMIMAGLDDPAYMKVLQNAELLVPDGTGVVWAAKYIGQPVAERVPGIDLVSRLMDIGQHEGWRVYMLGTTPETIQAAADRIRERFPNLLIVGTRDGYFADHEDEEIIADILEAKPDILLVGRAATNQEPWIGKYKDQLNIPVMMGVGGSFDVISGKLTRAPRLFQKFGLEWLHRLILEPYRYKRMLILPKFVMKVVRDKKNLQNRVKMK